MRLCMLTIGIVLWSSIGFGQAPPTTRAGDPPGSRRVGKFGDLSSLPIAGTVEIPADQILRVLQRDLALQPLLGPAAPLEEFMFILQRDLLAAYQASGFRDATVELRLDAEGNPLVIGVNEGPRFRRGGIKVEGAKTIDPSKLIDRLTTPRGRSFITELDPDLGTILLREPAEWTNNPDATWVEGSPASFRDVSRRNLIGKVREALAGMGYFRAQFSVDYVIVDQTVELRIRITEEGARATLADVEVRDPLRATRDDVMTFLGLRMRDPIDLDRLTQIQQALWDSGRFKRHILSVVPHEDGGGAVRLKMDLVENENVPSITEQLTPLHQVMLRAGHWLEGLSTSDYDLVFDLQTPRGSCDIVISPKNGWIIAMREASSPTTTPASRPRFTTGAAASGASLTFFSAVRRVQMQTGLPITRVRAILRAIPYFDGANNRWFSVTIGAGVNYSSGDQSLNPLALSFDFAPAFLLNEVTRSKLQFQRENGLEVIFAENVKVRIEPETGRLVDALFTVPGHRIHVATERGGFTRLQSEMTASAESIRPAGDSEGTLAALDFILGMASLMYFVEADTAPSPVLQPLARLLAPAIAPLLPQKPTIHPAMKDYKFFVPLEPEMLPITGSSGIINLFAASFADQIAPRGTWAWTLWRESTLVLDGMPQGTNRELLRVYDNPRTGPLASLAIAHSPLMRGNPNTRTLFARLGLRRLSADAVIDDLRVFLETPSSAQVVTAFVRELARMEPPDVHVLADALPEEWELVLDLLAAALRTMPDQPVDQALPRAIQLIWEPGLRKALATSLQSLDGAGAPLDVGR